MKWLKNLLVKYEAPRPLSLTDAEDLFGAVVNGRWPGEVDHMISLTVPAEIGANMINTATGKPTVKIYINQYVAPALVKAFDNVIKRKLQSELKSFDGCYQIRTIRGSGVISTHSYGLAIDINAKGNGLGETPTISPALVKCFTDAGWTWGGTFRRVDGMHFQIAGW